MIPARRPLPQKESFVDWLAAVQAQYPPTWMCEPSPDQPLLRAPEEQMIRSPNASLRGALRMPVDDKPSKPLGKTRF